tara:strand:+ start:325 stop:804 length:480 start_codon:yes stop_codon:yes gene_type:complete
MIVKTKKSATLLVPNELHKNFTETDNYLPENKELTGELLNIKGRRKGDDFMYRLFRTENGSLIYANTIEPIKTETMTEVNLGLDGTPTPTKIKMPNNAKYDSAHVIGAVIGTISGFLLARKLKKSKKQRIVFAVAGAAAGYVGGKLVAGKPVIDVKISS